MTIELSWAQAKVAKGALNVPLNTDMPAASQHSWRSVFVMFANTKLPNVRYLGNRAGWEHIDVLNGDLVVVESLDDAAVDLIRPHLEAAIHATEAHLASQQRGLEDRESAAQRAREAAVARDKTLTERVRKL